jgi:hypothetical protein
MRVKELQNPLFLRHICLAMDGNFVAWALFQKDHMHSSTEYAEDENNMASNTKF